MKKLNIINNIIYKCESNQEISSSSYWAIVSSAHEKKILTFHLTTVFLIFYGPEIQQCQNAQKVAMKRN